MQVHRSSRCVTALIRRLRSDRRGNVAMVVAVSALPLFTAVGVGVDVSSLVEAKTRLQNAADAAALAGASLYTSAGQATTAKDSAKAYFDKYAKGGFTNLTRSVTPSLPGVPPTITVAATASMPTTFLKVAGISSMTATVTAVAGIPSGQPVITLGSGFGSPSQALSTTNYKSTAADWNSIYMYVVPAGGGFPPLSEFYEMASSCSGAVDSGWSKTSSCNGAFGAVPPTVANYPITPDQPISFLFVNMTAGVSDPPGYNKTQYGALPGYYNLLTTASASPGLSPSAISDNSVSIIKSFGFTIPPQPGTSYPPFVGNPDSNCALQIVLVDPSKLPTSPPYPGECLAPTDPRSGYQYANLSCNQIAGRTFMYWWNDMGWWPVDNLNYTDMYYTLTCVPGVTNPDGGTIGGTGTGSSSSTGATAGQPAMLVQ